MDKDYTSGIYKITDLRNNKIYIGRAVNLHRRKVRHWSFLHPECHKPSCLQSEINMEIHQAMLESRNEDDFTFEVIEYCPQELLDEKEIYYMELYNSFVPNGYNTANRYDTGNHPKGEQHYNHKITEEQAKQIKILLKDGLCVKEIQNLIPEATIGIISNINNGVTWIDKNECYPLSRLNGVKVLTDEEVKIIKESKAKGVSTAELVKKFGVSSSQITSIASGKVRKGVEGPITKRFVFSEEQVKKFRQEYATTNNSIKEIWRQSGLKENIGYDGFCDMIKGKTYKQYPIYLQEEKYTAQIPEMKNKRYEEIIKLSEMGYTKTQIADKIGCSERTVYRALEKKG